MPNQMHNQTQHIAIVKLDHLGDVLWTTPLVSTLRQNFGSARLSIVCTPYTAPIWHNNPDIDDCISYSGGNWSNHIPSPDCVLCLDPRTSALQLCLESKSPMRVGYFYFPRGLSVFWPLTILTNAYLHPASRGIYIHEVSANLLLLKRMGCDIIPDTPTRLFLSQQEIKAASEFLQQQGYTDCRPLITVHLPPKWLHGGWPPAHLTRFILRIHESFPQSTIALSCGPGEEKLLELIKPILNIPLIIIPPIPFRIWAAIIKQSAILICRDCGPVHVAAALGVPVVSVFEESKRREHRRWEPWMVRNCKIFRPDQYTAVAEEKFIADLIEAARFLMPLKQFYS